MVGDIAGNNRQHAHFFIVKLGDDQSFLATLRITAAILGKAVCRE